MVRRKRVEQEPGTAPGISPVSAVIWSAATLAFGFILYNLFLGQSQQAIELARSRDPSKATNVEAQRNDINTIVVHYDPKVEEVQRLLLTTGHYKGLVDGVNGRQTQDAIEAYERDNKLKISTEITVELIDHIKYTRKLFDAAQFTGSTSAAQSLPHGNPLILRVQNALAAMGYDPGEATGILNPKTRSAIARFEQENKLAADGEIDRALITELARVTGDEALLKLAK